MLKNDQEIIKLATQGMIHPFEPRLISRASDKSVMSYGLGSYGYDIRLSPNDFRVFRHIPGTVVDPKNFNPENLESVALNSDQSGEYFVIPSHSYALGVAVERLDIPPNITVICLGKSSYARAGIIANVTPGEAGWKGYLTLEFSNSSSADCKVYANEGIVQLLFFEGQTCNTSYESRKGKYQNQCNTVTLPRV